MKKIVVSLLALLLVLALASCGAAPAVTTPAKTDPAVTTPGDTTSPDTVPDTTTPTPEAPESIQVAGLKGPTSIGMIRLMEDSKYNFTIAGTADVIAPKLLKGELDIAAVPANLAATLYNNSKGKVQVIAVNTLGVLYILERGNTLTDMASLRGKTIYTTGKGATPEYALRYLLTQNGLDPDKDVTLVFKSEAPEVVAVAKQTEGAIVMLPQPYVVAAKKQVEDLRVAIDLTAAWDALEGDSRLVTGVFVVRTAFAEQYPELVANFLAEAAASAEWVKAEPAQAATLVEKHLGIAAGVATAAIPSCNITHLTGAEMKTVLSGYLATLYAANPASVGGKLPEDAFYYGAE